MQLPQELLMALQSLESNAHYKQTLRIRGKLGFERCALNIEYSAAFPPDADIYVRSAELSSKFDVTPLFQFMGVQIKPSPHSSLLRDKTFELRNDLLQQYIMELQVKNLTTSKVRISLQNGTHIPK